MTKILKIAPEYIVNENKLYITTGDKTEEVKPDNNKLYKVVINGCEIRKEFKWFALMLRYQVVLPDRYKESVDKIKFIKYKSINRVRDKYYVTIGRPVIVDSKYAVPLNCSSVMFGRDGTVRNTISKKLIKTGIRTIVFNNNETYPRLIINNKQFRIHRLMLEAWVYNEQPDVYSIVNHKDGNKNNYTLSNLEWSTYKENLLHAIDTGLRTNNVAVMCRNYETGDICTFNSVKSMNEAFKLRHYTINEYKRAPFGKLFNGYEIRVAEDDRGWCYTDPDRPLMPLKAKYLYNVVTINSTYLSYDITEICIKHKIPKYFNYNQIKNALEDKNIFITKENLSVTGPYQLYDINTNEIIECDSTGELSNISGISKSKLDRYIHTDERYAYAGYAFRIKSKIPWDTNFIYPDNFSREVKVIYHKTIEIYTSVNQLADKLNTTHKTIYKHIETETPFENKFLIYYNE